jgi:internalin A
VNASGMKFLSSCPAIRQLVLHDVKMDVAELVPHVARLTNLQRLDINNGPMSRDLLAAAATHKLEELGVRNTASANDVFEPIGQMTNLKKLFISFEGEVSDGIIPHLQPLKQLVSLHVANTLISVDGICKLGSSRILNLSWGSSKGEVTNSTYSQIAKAFPSLEYLGLPRDRAFTVGELEWLASALPDLETIAMDYGRPQPGCLKALSRMAKLDSLTLWKCQLADEQISELADFKKLRKLGINDTKLGDACLEHIRGLKSLRELNVAGTAITEAALAAFKKARPDVELKRSTW